MKTEEPKTVYIIFMLGFGPESFYAHTPGQRKSFNFLLQEEIENAGYKVKFVTDAYGLEDVAAIISWEVNQNTLNSLAQHPTKRCILLTFEPPVVAPTHYHPILKKYFGSIFTLIDDLVDNKTYFKLYTMSSRLVRIKNIQDFSTKKLCCLINNNKLYRNPGELYSERRKAISFFTPTGEFDLYGLGWEGIASWKGEARDDEKMNALRKYKFIICYENMTNQRGYVSEKIIEAFAGGCVPVYLGATNIEDYVPKESFVDFRKYRSYAELYEFMQSVDRNSYQAYLDAAQNFLESPRSRCFHCEEHVNKIMERIQWAQQ